MKHIILNLLFEWNVTTIWINKITSIYLYLSAITVSCTISHVHELVSLIRVTNLFLITEVQEIS